MSQMLKKLAEDFLKADIRNDGSAITVSFLDKEPVLPAMEDMTEVLNRIDEARELKELGFDEEEDYDRD